MITAIQIQIVGSTRVYTLERNEYGWYSNGQLQVSPSLCMCRDWLCQDPYLRVMPDDPPRYYRFEIIHQFED